MANVHEQMQKLHAATMAVPKKRKLKKVYKYTILPYKPLRYRKSLICFKVKCFLPTLAKLVELT